MILDDFSGDGPLAIEGTPTPCVASLASSTKMRVAAKVDKLAIC